MTMRATFDVDGLVTGFYPPDIVGENYPEGAVEISTEQYQDLLTYQGLRRYVDGKIVEYTPPAPVPTADDYRRAIQALIDTKAQEKQYDSGATLASYVNSTVPEWSAQAQAFVTWRDSVWVYAFAELEKVQSGEREQPSIEDFLAELPAFEWSE